MHEILYRWLVVCFCDYNTMRNTQTNINSDRSFSDKVTELHVPYIIHGMLHRARGICSASVTVILYGIPNDQQRHIILWREDSKQLQWQYVV